MSYRAVSFILTLISILCYPVEISCDIVGDVADAHRTYRAKHGVPPLQIDEELSAYATEWAQHLLKTGNLVHRKQNKYGENLYYSMGVDLDGTSAVDAWYDEIKDYDFDNPSFSPATGHFTQVIWKSSKYLGVGVAQNEDTIYIVCNYYPPGNVIGEFEENVLPA